jgi:hypothetical protein
VLLVLLSGGAERAGAGDSSQAAFLGTWRGTSLCVNRELAPACKDETVVYEVQPARKPGTVTLKADKIVDGKREPMGDLDFAYDAAEGCWRSEFETPRVHGVWCLVVEGDGLKGSLRVLPQNASVRDVQLKRDRPTRQP